jgi:hypothetical protein
VNNPFEKSGYGLIVHTDRQHLGNLLSVILQTPGYPEEPERLSKAVEQALDVVVELHRIAKSLDPIAQLAEAFRAIEPAHIEQITERLFTPEGAESSVPPITPEATTPD